MTYRLNGVRYGQSINLEFTELAAAERKARQLLKGASWLILAHVNSDGEDVEHVNYA